MMFDYLKDMTILLLLSCKKYLKVIEILNTTNFYELAFFFMKICIELDFVSVPECIGHQNLTRENLKIATEFLSTISKEQVNSEHKYLFKIINNYVHFKKKFQ